MSRGTAAGLSALFAFGSLPGVHPDEVIAAPADSPKAEKGTVRFDPAGDDRANVPALFRLAARDVAYELAPKFDLRHSGVSVADLTFPSPVESGIAANDTVHAEYFRPAGKGPFPAVVVLDIMDGQQVVGRGEAMWLAQHGVAALVVHMAHYGPRRPAGSKVRMVSPDVPRTTAAIRQTVLDCRCATAWLASRPELNAARLGIVGTSLGSFVSAMTAAAEPKLGAACLLLTGGGLVDAYYDHPKAKAYLPFAELFGGKAGLKKLIGPIDPLTYAEQLKGKRLLIVAASRDDVVPPSAAKALWEATGKQKIVWFDATHVGAALYAYPAMTAVIDHLTAAK